MLEAGRLFAVKGPLLSASHLTKHFSVKGGLLGREVRRIHAVDDVSFDLAHGETLGLVGESGSGKTTVGRLLLRLEVPDAGAARFESVDVFGLRGKALKSYRRDVQAVFQDPLSAFNPRMRVRDIISEPALAMNLVPRKELAARAKQLLSEVGLSAAMADRFPHEFSGGQRQRIAVARAISTQPKMLVLDEPVSALDVSVRAQVLNVLKELQAKLSLSYLFIAHDLPTVKFMSDRLAVMYLGRIVEEGPAHQLCLDPVHPYTRGLVAAVLSPKAGRMEAVGAWYGEIPSAIDIPSGCRFRTRCPLAISRCAEVDPVLAEFAPGRRVACGVLVPRAFADEGDAPAKVDNQELLIGVNGDVQG